MKSLFVSSAWVLILSGIACSQNETANGNDAPQPDRKPVVASLKSSEIEWLDSERDDWPGWRGPKHDGQAFPGQNAPTSWSEKENVVWMSPIPGRGHGSPTVVGNAVYLPTADEGKGSQSVVCLNKETGAQVWMTEVHASGGMMKNKKSSAASSTIACDGEKLYISFPNSDAIQATALTLDGKIVWQQKVSDYVVHQGYGASPFLYEDLVIVAADNKGGGAIAALNKSDGNIAWRNDRPKTPNYPSPIVWNLDGRDQLILTGCDKVSSFDPATGKTLWEIDGATTECVTTTVTDGERVFSSGGYPTNHMSAILADGSGTVEWKNGDRVYVPSFLYKDGYLYGVMDAGIAGCWNSATGKEMWKKRLGGNFTASPVMVGDTIYATSEKGETTLFRADPAEFKQIGKNKLGDEVYSSPAICGGRIYVRVAKYASDQREEFLYCLGESKAP